MGGLVGGKSKSIKPPTPAPPPPIPTTSADAEDDAYRRSRSKSGFKSTILTGDLVPGSGKKGLLG